MQQQTTKMNKPFAAIIALLAWGSVIAQLWVNLHSGAASTGELIIRFFSYFTVLCNIAVAICCSMVLLKPGTNFFAKPTALTAVTVYIAIVGIVYNTILRWLWNPTGIQKILDDLLHVWVPILFVVYWILMVPKNNLQWKNAFPWLCFPLIYCIYVLLRGAFSGFYPYPFMNVTELGYRKVLINSAAVCGTFLFVSFLLITIAKWTSKPAEKKPA